MVKQQQHHGWVGLSIVIRATVLLVLTLISFNLAWAQSPANDSVRVKLLHVTLPITIDGSSLQVTDLDREGIKSVSLPKNELVTLDRKTIDGQKLWFLKRGDKVVRSSKQFIEIQSIATKIKIAGYDLPVPLIFSPRGAKGADVIGAIKMDEYLEGVLAGEMPATWPLEALKAQAVAARTYTLYQMEGRAGEAYQLEGSVLDQVYSLALPETQKEKIRQAVQETQGLVLTQNKKVIKAFYHSDCGGQTEDPSVVWGVGLPTKSAPILDTECAFSPTGKWTLTVPLDEVKSKLGSMGEKILGSLKSARVASRTPSQRASLLAFNDGTRDIFVSGNKLRQILGYKKLKSTLFTLVQKDQMIEFHGRGFGHGSGLCQWGAKTLAQKGLRLNDILKHYYPQARLLDLHVANR